MKRYEELDSMRGIAALMVIFSHLALLTPNFPWVLGYTPLHFLWAGSEAVIFFFILSGFVLALPFFNGKGRTYPEYITKRIIRIYFPYVVSLIVSFISYAIIYNGGVFEYTEWLSQKWNDPLSVDIVMDHLLLIGNFNTGEINPVVWSLSQEMRISLIFPIIIVLIYRFNSPIMLGIGVVLSSLTGINYVFGFEETLGWRNSFFDTLNFTSMFIIGALLAKNRELLISSFQRLNLKYKVILFVIGFLSYTYSKSVQIIPVKFAIVVMDWGVALGVSIFVVVALSSKNISKILKNKFLIFNGKISFSLYLYHFVVLAVVFHIFERTLPFGIMLLLSLLFMYIVAYLSWKYTELPSITWGRKVNFSKFSGIKIKETENYHQ